MSLSDVINLDMKELIADKSPEIRDPMEGLAVLIILRKLMQDLDAKPTDTVTVL